MQILTGYPDHCLPPLQLTIRIPLQRSDPSPIAINITKLKVVKHCV